MAEIPLTGAQRTRLRGLGQKLEPSLKVGKAGLTPAFFVSVRPSTSAWHLDGAH